jgi:hypothetical protein
MGTKSETRKSKLERMSKPEKMRQRLGIFQFRAEEAISAKSEKSVVNGLLDFRISIGFRISFGFGISLDVGACWLALSLLTHHSQDFLRH